MEDISKGFPGKQSKNKEFYKKFWLSLFEWRTLSTCQDNDLDLFGASALLKSAFYQFAKLKKRLNESQNLVDALTFELNEMKSENEKFSKKLDCLQATQCTHCQSLKVIQSYSDGLEWDSENYPQGRKEPDKGFAIPRPPVNRKMECSSKKNGIPTSEAQCVRELDFGSCERVICDQVTCDSIGVVNPPLSLLETQIFSPLPEEGGHNEPLTENLNVSTKTMLKTPEKKQCPDHSIEKSSPVLNSQKRGKRFSFSPCVNAAGSNPNAKNLKSPSFLIPEGGSSELEERGDKVSNQWHVGEGLSLAVKPKGKRNLSMLRLKQKMPMRSAQCVLAKNKVSCTKEGASSGDGLGSEKCPIPPPGKVRRGVMGGEPQEVKPSPSNTSFLRCRNTTAMAEMPAPKDKPSPVLLFVPQVKATNVEEDDESIIMPSPNSSKGHADTSGNGGDAVGPSSKGTFRKAGVGVSQSKALLHVGQELHQPMPTDTEVTYFVPMGEEEQVSEDEEGGGGENSENELPPHEGHASFTVAAAVRPHPHGFLSSFDRVPRKCPSPKFKHQQAPVRKRSERMQLEGWECKACKKYYDAVGIEIDPHERKGRVNKCSRHRDRYSPRKCTPKGFWDPLFPETPEG
ncbi:uncharacterized protein LOC124157047 [Ischnura elegans]|uniref:uncharacterized protein LOC124157047 n=1 Tax=Ischnura elegans TaxID=197161 RepID=UPI001ED8A142|nr:uncharacterized protein LOC124157047 [Ischnura elegans]XP_046387478.1 uncharacterized protein LOC124157047 [Ischnura elegans]